MKRTRQERLRMGFLFLLVCLFFGLVTAMGGGSAGSAGGGRPEDREASKMEKATFAAGCFWGVEAAFRGIDGVVSTQVGYTGGRTENPDYHAVCSNLTGHAEAVEVTYDPAQVSYDDLLKVFWELHDPTQVDRQGPDVGSQYRSVIFYHGPEQREKAEASMRML